MFITTELIYCHYVNPSQDVIELRVAKYKHSKKVLKNASFSFALYLFYLKTLLSWIGLFLLFCSDFNICRIILRIIVDQLIFFLKSSDLELRRLMFAIFVFVFVFWQRKISIWPYIFIRLNVSTVKELDTYYVKYN